MTGKTVTLQTLTPLWTGGIEGGSNQLHLTGIIGSLRYWYEGIVRGLGGSPCIHVSDSSDEKHTLSRYETKNCEPSAESTLCPVCRLFGTTGWKRRFRISMTGLTSQPLFFMSSRSVHAPTASWFKRIFRGQSIKGGRGILFQSGVLWGCAELKILGASTDVDRVAAILGFIERFGGIGAKTQNGFGQFKIDPDVTDLAIKRELMGIRTEIAGSNVPASDQTAFFSIRDFFSRTYHLRHPEPYFSQLEAIGDKVPDAAKKLFYPCAYDLRYKNQQKHPVTRQGQNNGLRLRFKDRKWPNYTAAKLFGTDKKNSWDKNNWAGRIHVSHPFRAEPNGNWLLKIWGCVPEGIWQNYEKHPDLKDIESTIDAYISGRQGMFPDSTIVHKYNKEDWINAD